MLVFRLVLVATVLTLACSGCNSPAARLNAPPHGRVFKRSDMQGTYTYMSDNALLADMTVSDMHFLPHRAELSDLGERRVGRLAALMEAYGGTIRFNTGLTDADLIAARTDAIVAKLVDAGIDTTHEVVTRDMPGGRGMAATESVLIKAKEGTYDPKKQSQTGSMESSAAGK